MDQKNTGIVTREKSRNKNIFFNITSHQMRSAVLWNLTLSGCYSAVTLKKQQAGCWRGRLNWAPRRLSFTSADPEHHGQGYPSIFLLAPCIAMSTNIHSNCFILILLLHRLIVSLHLAFPIYLYSPYYTKQNMWVLENKSSGLCLYKQNGVVIHD